jgi:predicted MFS family arabinose efflux permease
MPLKTNGFVAGFKSFFNMKPRRQLREIYVFLLLFSFASALVTVFEPIFFYTQGISLWEISLYYAAHYTLYVLLMPFGGKFAARFGYERSLTLSAPVFVMYFLLLASLDQHRFVFYAAPVVLTLFKILYWPAYHASFVSFSDLKNRGTEQSWVRFVEYGAGVLGPVIGGIIAQMYGFPVLFLLTAVTVACAGVALLWTKEKYHFAAFSYGSPWRIIFSPQHRNMVVGMMGWGENLVYLAIWPVWLMIVLGDVETVGLAASISAVIATAVGFIVGEMTDRLSAKRLLRIVVPLTVLGYLWRMVAILPWQVAVGDVVARTSYIGVGIPFMARLYRQGKKVDPLEYSVAFEIVLALVKAVLAFILAAVFILVPGPAAFMIAFALAAVLSLFYLAL